ncbi:MAG: family 20 glycosylhydrolase [Clostridia bacterium]|nr:family 20 glycosylhydrolase [Clostridia bacterium]
MYLIPKPKALEAPEKDVLFDLPQKVDGGEFNNAAKTLCGLTNRFSYKKLSLGDGGIIFRMDGNLDSGSYRLSVGEDGVRLDAPDEDGAFNGVSTLIQLITEEGKIAKAEIADSPSSEYSSVMVDLARVRHSFEMVKQYVDLCRFYKIRVLHLHFTDDQSYTLPSLLFPDLSTPGRSYTLAQIRELNEYARLRGVRIMPEIDVPGHCKAFQTNYSDTFGTKGIIPINKKSMDAMKSLFKELCDLFPYSEYIHIGGDEAEIKKWLENEADFEYYRSVGIDPKDENAAEFLLAHFVNEMATAVFEKGRQPIAWEGFRECANHLVRKDLIMVSWENYYQTTPQLLKAGFKIINCSWQPLYVVSPRTFWRERDVFEWDLTYWKPIHNKSPYYGSFVRVEDCPEILGGGLCVWSDSIERFHGADFIPEGTQFEFEKAIERIPALAENVWNREKIRDFSDYLKARITLQRKLNKILADD